MNLLAAIIAANAASSLISILLAAAISFRFLSAMLDRLVCASAGLLLTVALVHLLPEALQGTDPATVGRLILGAIIGLFLLEKLALIHHTHHHEGDEHHHHHGHDAHEARRGGGLILVGDACHNFGDGVLIAAAFISGPAAGIAATVAVVAHEIPHEIGDFMILLNAGFSRRRALIFNVMASSAALAGGVAGYFLLERARSLLPYALALAAASFIYIALSDLLPEMMRRKPLRQSLPEVGFVLLGVALGVLASSGA